MLVGSIITIGMLLFGIRLEDIFEDSPPLLEIFLTLPTFTLTTFIVRRVIDRRSFKSLGFDIDSRTLIDLLVGFAIPGLLMGGIFLFELAVGWLTVIDYAWDVLPISNWLPDLVIWLGVYIAVGIQEEMLSRGYHLQNIADGLNLPMGILFSSLIFALLHIGNPFSSFASFVGLLAAGYFLAFAWVRTKRLWLPIGLHIGWNFFEGNIFGFAVSGTNSFKLIQHQVNGPTLITGGNFGPEAGLIVLPAMLLGTYLVYLYTNRDGSQKMS
jgi:membrane protease YdiL (CAAX protease family)